jgi:hypothetical protein
MKTININFTYKTAFGSVATPIFGARVTNKHFMMRLKRFILPVVAAISIIATCPTAMASPVPDINWSLQKCIEIPRLVQRLIDLANKFEEKADDARAAGNEGLADAYESAAVDATIEASEGELAYNTVDCLNE